MLTKVLSYREQNGCHNCKNRFEESDYDSPTNYFCNRDNSLDRKLNVPPYRLTKKIYLLLEELRDAHHVSEWGICDLFLLDELA